MAINIIGIMTMVNRVKIGLKMSITMTVPVSVNILENTWMNDVFSVELTFSISFVSRLINSGKRKGRISVKASGFAHLMREAFVISGRP